MNELHWAILIVVIYTVIMGAELTRMWCSLDDDDTA